MIHVDYRFNGIMLYNDETGENYATDRKNIGTVCPGIPFLSWMENPINQDTAKATISGWIANNQIPEKDVPQVRSFFGIN